MKNSDCNTTRSLKSTGFFFHVLFVDTSKDKVKMEEEWKDIKGFEGAYLISNKGNVFDARRNCKKAKRQNCKTGYVIVDLKLSEKKKTLYVHRLVAEAFIENPNSYPVINHKDEDKTNNCADNLEWCTQKYNVHYGNGIEKNRQAHIGKKMSAETKKKQSLLRQGEKHWNYGKHFSEESKTKNMLSQPTRKRVVNKTTGKMYESIAEAGRENNIPTSSIAKVCNGIYKHTHGQEWGWC